jgi:pimeloyl-ACP methyl ester carboxylesterase
MRRLAPALILPLVAACATSRVTVATEPVPVPPSDATYTATTFDTTWYITNRARRNGELGRALADSLEFGLVVTSYRERVGPGSDGRFLEDIDTAPGDSARFSAEEFIRLLRARDSASSASGSGAIMYVHGYAVSFGRGVRQGAEIAHRGTHGGPMIAFSWPSHTGMVTWPSVSRAYRDDSVSAAASRGAFREALAIVRQAVRPGSLSLLGHSLGGALIAEALTAPSTMRDSLMASPVGALVLFAPDISIQRFKDSLATALRPVAARRVVYASDDDFMMDSSRMFNGSPRVGEATPARLLTPLGFEVVDVARGRRANGALRKMFEPGHAMRFASSALYDFFSVVRGVPEDCRGAAGLAQRSEDGSWWLSDAKIPVTPPSPTSTDCGSK